MQSEKNTRTFKDQERRAEIFNDFQGLENELSKFKGFQDAYEPCTINQKLRVHLTHNYVCLLTKKIMVKTYMSYLEQPSCPPLHAMQRGVLDENVVCLLSVFKSRELF